MTKQIPNIFTLLNLVFGCIAIVFIMQTNSFHITELDGNIRSISLPENIAIGSLCIFIAAVIDFLDGFVARLLKATSPMGKQLDSLSDVVSFGVAPALIMMQLLRMCYLTQSDGLEISLWLLIPAFLFACAGAYRLARFNLDESQTEGFKGVPIPAAGLIVASLPLILQANYYNGSINELLFNKWVFYGFILLLSWLMISRLPLMALKFKNFSIKDNLPKFILIVISLLAALLLQWLAVPVVFLCYILLSLLFKNTKS